MELELEANQTYEEFCAEVIEILEQNPNFWKSTYSHANMRRIFEGDFEISDAINHIGVLDPPGKPKMPGISSKVIVLRNS